MAEKQKILKRLLIRAAVMTVVVACVMLSIVFLASKYDTSIVAEKASKISKNESITSQISDITNFINMSGQGITIYRDYFSNHNKELAIKRDVFNKFVSELSKKNNLAGNVEATISSISPIKEKEFILKTGKALKSNISMSFSVASDSSVYNFIYDLQHTLPGMIILTNLKLSKTGDFSKSNVSEALTNHTILPLIKVEMSIIWVGIIVDNASIK